MPLHIPFTCCHPSRRESPTHMATRWVSGLSQVRLISLNYDRDFFLKVAVAGCNCIFNGRGSIEIPIIIVSHMPAMFVGKKFLSQLDLVCSSLTQPHSVRHVHLLTR